MCCHQDVSIVTSSRSSSRNRALMAFGSVPTTDTLRFTFSVMNGSIALRRYPETEQVINTHMVSSEETHFMSSLVNFSIALRIKERMRLAANMLRIMPGSSGLCNRAA